MHGMRRAAETLVRSYLEAFPCFAVIGVRQCGKTTLLKTLPANWKHYDLERRADHEVVIRDPDTFFRLNPRQVTLDEVSLASGVFPALRVAIHQRSREKGRYVLTGSSSPELMRSISETLAGRIGIIELAPFSWSEVTETSDRDSVLRRLSNRKLSAAALIEGSKPRAGLRLAHDYWFRGGFPEPWLNAAGEFQKRWVEQYLQTYLYRDVKRLFPGLDEVRFRRFVEMLGGLSGRTLNFAEAARALAVSQPTARDYFEIAHGTFIWRRVPAYSRNVMKRAVKHPRGYLRDSGLLHTLLRIPDLDALLSHPQAGGSWEGMVVEEILRQLSALGVGYDYSYYRTGAGAEVDLVLEADFGRVAVEIKRTSSPNARDLRGIRDFVREQKARVGIVINTDAAARVYEEKIVGLPFNWL